MSDRDHTGFLELAATDPGLEEVLADERMVLYRVRRDGPPPLVPDDRRLTRGRYDELRHTNGILVRAPSIASEHAVGYRRSVNAERDHVAVDCASASEASGVDPKSPSRRSSNDDHLNDQGGFPCSETRRVSSEQRSVPCS